jgi:predicted membrane protein
MQFDIVAVELFTLVIVFAGLVAFFVFVIEGTDGDNVNSSVQIFIASDFVYAFLIAWFVTAIALMFILTYLVIRKSRSD